MKKIQIIGVVGVIVLAIGLVWFFRGPAVPQVSKLDAPDTVANFYDQWLKAVQEPRTANPSKATLAKSPLLSPSLITSLASTLSNPGTTVDPVLCQTVVPKAISIRNVYVGSDKAQILVTSKDTKVTEQALVTLNKDNNAWQINEIKCAAGEFAPEREFSFEKEGYLLKGSVPKPYDPKKWHLIFEDNGELGHLVPLIFDSTSQCTSLEGVKSVCKPDKFTETTKVYIRAQMTERGANVKQLQFIK